MSEKESFSAAVIREFQFLIDDYDFVLQEGMAVDEWGDLKHRYVHADWFIAPVYNTDEKTINVEFGNEDCLGKAFTLHTYMRLVDPATFYELGFGIANSDCDIEPLVKLYANALRTSGAAILRRDKNVCRQMLQAMKLGEGMCPSYGQQPHGKKIESRYV